MFDNNLRISHLGVIDCEKEMKRLGLTRMGVEWLLSRYAFHVNTVGESESTGMRHYCRAFFEG